MTGKASGPKALPSSHGRSRGRLVPFAVGGLLLLLAAVVGSWWFLLRTAPARADVLLHPVKFERMVVTVAEKGTLESADNRDIVCKVRAGTKGFASTINWVIDDGTRVKPGQELMRLDDSALKDQEDAKQIDLVNALANKLSAKKDVEIAATQNKLNIAKAEQDLTNAVNDLNNYTGLTFDLNRVPLTAVGGGQVAFVEAGTFRQSVDNKSGAVKLAESDVEQYRERAAWAERMVKLSYMSAAQAQAEKSKLDSAVETLRSKRAELSQLLASDREQQLTKLILARDYAQINLEKVNLEAVANLAKFEAVDRKCELLLAQVQDALNEIALQRAECRINAPSTIQPDSMVVYFKNESNRFQQNSQGMIEQGAQVKEGQKMLRIPNLRRMQVNTKVHEAMVARVRGDVRVPTHMVDTMQKVTALTTDPFLRLMTQRPEGQDPVREKFRNLEYRTTSEGQKATVRVDALPDRLFEAHVRTVAAVASQADFFASDVKMYQTIVLIDYEVSPDGTKRRIENEQLKPDMTAEVTITVDTAKDPVLTVPVQAVIGGTEMGAKREVFVKTPTGFDRREVKLGLYNEKSVEIREGLAENDEVVLNPKVLLAPEEKTRTRDGDGKGGGNKGGGGKGGMGDGAGGPKGEGGPPGGGGGKRKGGGGGPPPVQ
ncbi:hypothetical protein FTUN_1139 [Frigoriglobus tundricola]|uniref:CzcB-like C-terminal circularly permuted SH3-like domain-containing protein n=1 Tax=Frigoriglobus tundricola TaxID=2774151 RepID=A0A6M5YK03_9BACT|nr:hypothetical protein FTUN_1139 [Frigoriglobus tundricola]